MRRENVRQRGLGPKKRARLQGGRGPRAHGPREAAATGAGPRGPRLEVTVERLDEDGNARGRSESASKPVVIASGAVPGDRVMVGLDHDGKGALYGRVLSVIAPSPDRVEPRCSVVTRCGACPWQAARYEAQLRWKRDALERSARAYPALKDVPIAAPIALADPYGYRTKIQMPVGGRAGALEAGFFRAATKELVVPPEGGCPVQHPLGNRIVAEALTILSKARIEPYDERRHEGTLRYLLLRVDGEGGKAALTLVVRDGRIPGRDGIAERLGRIPGVSGVYLNVQPARGNVVLGRRTERINGRERLLVSVLGRKFLLSPTAFFQTNAGGAAALVTRARAHLPGPYRTLADLYCGVGLFARSLADRAEEVLGVEENPAAIEDAIAGASFEKVTNVGFLAAPALAWARVAEQPVDALVVDPPRSGLEEGLVDAIAGRLRPKALVYVSCNPATLLRDLALLAARGYKTTAIDPVDMFPHTPHLECVAALRRG